MTIDRDTLLDRIRRLEHALEASVSPATAEALERNLVRVTAERDAALEGGDRLNAALISADARITAALEFLDNWRARDRLKDHMIRILSAEGKAS